VEDDFQVETRGEVNLKGIREPMEVFRLIGAAAT
jgi:class 3 adenylate cyclase